MTSTPPPATPILRPAPSSLTPAESGSSTCNEDINKPFTIRAELLAPTRLARKTQLLFHTRSVAVEVIAHEVFLLVLACTKFFVETTKTTPQIGILGGGTVGATVIMTLLANGYDSERIALSTRQPDQIPRCEALRTSLAVALFQSIPRYYDNARLAHESNVLVLCMPPSHLKSVAIQTRHALAANEPLVVSVLCGVTHATLSKVCGSQAVVRVQPDVAKIASQWQEENDDIDQVLPSKAQELAGLPRIGLHAKQSLAGRDRQSLIRSATEAIAGDVRNLLQAFCLLCRRVCGQEVSVNTLGHILFGDKSARVLTALKYAEVDANGEEKQHKEVKTLLEVSKWRVEWDQDLIELQEQLAARALQQSR